MALHQFFAMEGRMKRNEEFANKYRIFMTEYEALGHMSPVHDNEEEGYYTPHLVCSHKTNSGLCSTHRQKRQLEFH